MRRVLSVILLFLGGWLLTCEGLVVWLDTGQGLPIHLGMTALMLAFAAPFVLLGMWASPGSRLAELGITVMIGVGIGALMAIMIGVMTHDPGFKQAVPPEKAAAIARLHIVVWWGLLNVAVLGGLGWLAWHFGQPRARS
jgi:hypothetical protein